MSENPVTIGAVFDGEQLAQSFREGTDQVNSQLQKFKLELQEASTASQRAFRQIADDTKTMAATASVEMQRVAAAVVANNKAQAELRAATVLTRDKTLDAGTSMQVLAAAQTKAAASAKELASAEQAAGIGLDEAAEKAEKARASMALMGEETGIRIPRHLRSIAAEMPIVATLMETAFSGFAILGFVEILSEVPAKIAEATEKLSGWNEEAKKAYDQQVEFNRKQITSVEELARKNREASIEGLSGVGRATAEQKNLDASIKETTEDLQKLQRRQAELTAASDQRQNWNPGVAKDPVGNLAARFATNFWDKNEFENQKKELAQIKERIEEDVKKLQQEKGPESASASGKVKQAKSEDEESRQTALTEATKAGETARAEFREQVARQMHELGLSTLAQEVSELKGAEQQKFEALRSSIEKQKQIAREKAERAHTDPSADIDRLNGEEEAAAVRHKARMSEIDNSAALEQKQRDEALAQAKISATLQTEEARVRAEEQSAQQLYASHKITAERETELLFASEREQSAAKKTALEARIAEAEKEPEKNRALLVTLHAELEASESEHQARMTQIRTEGDKKALADAKAEMDQRVAFAQSSSDRELEASLKTDDRRLQSHRITLSQWARDEETAIQNWYAKQISVLTQAAEFAKLKYGEQSREYQAMLNKLAELDQKRTLDLQRVEDKQAQQWQQMVDKMGNTFFGGLNSWLRGQGTWRENMKKTYLDLEMSAIQSAERMVLHMIAAEMRQLVAHLATNQAKIASDTATAAQGESIGTLAALKSVARAAAKAGAHAFSSVFESVPFPANVILAPAAAAAAFAGTLAFGSMPSASNGMVSADEQMAFIHKNEMVLPAPLSLGFQKLLAEGGTTSPASAASGGNHTHHYHINGAGDPDAVADRVMRKVDRRFRTGGTRS